MPIRHAVAPGGRHRHVPGSGWMPVAIAIAAPLGVAVYDHIIVGRQGHVSLRGQRLI